jgi:hypothetical protein
MKRLLLLSSLAIIACASPLLAQPTGCTVVAPGVADGTFEAGVPWPAWTVQTSTNFGTPNCDIASCGTGGGAGAPFAGNNWSWFGGIPAAETATLGQNVTIPPGPFLFVRHQFRVGAVATPFTDTLTVRVDGTVQVTYPEPTVADPAYTQRYVNVTAFANGAPHALLYTYIGPTTGTANFLIDNVELVTCTTPVELLDFNIG